MKKSTITTLLLSAFLISALSLPAYAEGREKNRSGNFTNRKGEQGSYERKVTKTDQGRKVENTITRPDGSKVTTQKDFIRNEDGSVGYSGTRTGPKGTSTSQGTITKNPDGTINRQGTWTGPGGKSGSVNSTTTKTEDGRQTTRTFTGPDGQTYTNMSETKRQDGSVVKTFTNRNGQTRSWVIDGSGNITPQ